MNFAKRGEVGAAFCVWHDGELVVDLWGGLSDRASGRTWEADTLCLVFSVTKGITATCFLMAAERGLIDYDAKVADYWPEFGDDAKRDITVRTLMNHRAGLAALDRPLKLDDLDTGAETVAAMQAQQPLWPPGEGQGYHGVTFGTYCSVLFEKATGRSLSQWVADELAGPLQADIYMGLPESQDGRMCTLYPTTTAERVFKALPYVLFNDVVERKLLKAMTKKTSTPARAFSQPEDLVKGLSRFNEPSVWRQQLAWAGGVVTARGLVKMYAALANGGELDGVRLVEEASIAPVMTRQSFEDLDRVICKPVGWSQGFIKEEPHLFSPHIEAFGHPGMGGALGFCDPPRKLAWAYTLNKLDFRLRSPRALALSHAVYDCLTGERRQRGKQG